MASTICLEETTMTQPARVIQSTNEEIPGEVVDLATAIGELPTEYAARLRPVLNRVIESTKRRRRILSLVQDALGQLRLDMKYLVFDLEATRRERDEYRQRLEGGRSRPPRLVDDRPWTHIIGGWPLPAGPD
jgi:hypothetical protein